MLQVRPAGQAGYPISLVASLDTVPVKCCVPLLKSMKRQQKTIQQEPCDSKGYTRTHHVFLLPAQAQKELVLRIAGRSALVHQGKSNALGEWR